MKPEQRLLENLTAHVEKHAPSSLWVAYSGGLDSTVLLFLSRQIAGRFTGTALKAVHVHHGLMAEADDWVTHCQEFCQGLDVPLEVLYVDATPDVGQSPEAAARDARYAAITDLIEPGDFVLLAHHQDDQAETLMLQLLRGAGPRGLAGMAAFSALGYGFKVRPILDLSRAQLQEIAQASGLSWVDDPSNTRTDYDRNFLRQEIFPQLETRWPALASSLTRSASLCAEADGLLDELALLDLERLSLSHRERLPVDALLALSSPRRRNLLRVWIGRLGLTLPGFMQLRRIEDELLTAREDAQPQVVWPGAEVRRYQGDIYAMSPVADTYPLDSEWDMSEPLDLGDGRFLIAEPARGQGLRLNLIMGATIHVRYRSGGESIKPKGDRHTRSLHKLFQQSDIPPWERERIPLVWQGEQLIAVPGLCVADAFAANNAQSGVELVIA